MAYESEQTLENKLIEQLKSLNYQRVHISNEGELVSNLKEQLEIHNNTKFTNNEFSKILNKLNKGNIFEKAKTLRDKFVFTKDNGDTEYIEFLDTRNWCKNEYQVTNQVTIEGKYKNRYDVTLLINGLPLVQIELKRKGLELKEAFNQVNRYQKHSYSFNSKLFNYIQLFIISNGVNTKYYSNNKKQSFKQTFFWSDEKNNHINELERFTNIFLEPCHISKMISKYIVLAEVDKILMVLRPYQYYAVENIVKASEESVENGYIWHTTGSGKTLTSFKASQILMANPKIRKIVFVVDRKDLDYQTTKEFNSFSDGSVDGTDNTKILVEQFKDDTKLIVTTIQKLNTAISKTNYLKDMEKLKDKKIVFIFDECHRSQFGDTHTKIVKFFNNYQMFGFTGTPIFSDNAVKSKTTQDLFGKPLHKYIITDAIRDENVLKFSIEYIGKYSEKENSINNPDIEVEKIDIKELIESPKRINKIVDYILANHNRKTHGKTFTAILCVSSIDILKKYYELFKSKKHKLKIATIFSYSANEENKEELDEVLDFDINIDSKNINKHSREKLDEYMEDYNKLFNTKYTTKDSSSFYKYYNDVALRVKDKKIDILIVVNMFLTGFDSPNLNTLYVDKNLKYHGLIQAFSRTNRIVGEKKSQGNIVCFRNLKAATDTAIALFSDENAKSTILLEPYEDYIKKFDEEYDKLIDFTPTIDDVDNLKDENEEFEFIKLFRDLIRIKNILKSFSDFKFDDLKMEEQEFENFKSKYLDLYDKVKTNREKEKVSILDDIDFELELIHKDEINVAYILQLLFKIKNMKDEKDKKRGKGHIDNILNGEVSLRSKKELISKFIDKNLLDIDFEIEEAFNQFWKIEKKEAFDKLCEEEGVLDDKLQAIIDEYLFTNRKPLSDDVIKILKVKPKLLKRKPVTNRIIDKILDFVDTFINGIK